TRQGRGPALAAGPVAGRAVEQGLREAVPVELGTDGLGLMLVGKQELDRPEASRGRRTKTLEEWALGEHEREIGGKSRRSNQRITSQALMKKSCAPKLPDFSARHARGPERASVQGTPGSISGPISKALMPRASTTAPEVSPPAMMKRVTPRPARPSAIAARACSTSPAARSRPSADCALAIASGSAVE